MKQDYLEIAFKNSFLTKWAFSLSRYSKPFDYFQFLLHSIFSIYQKNKEGYSIPLNGKVSFTALHHFQSFNSNSQKFICYEEIAIMEPGII
jgi:hypothetical protein